MKICRNGLVSLGEVGTYTLLFRYWVCVLCIDGELLILWNISIYYFDCICSKRSGTKSVWLLTCSPLFSMTIIGICITFSWVGIARHLESQISKDNVLCRSSASNVQDTTLYFLIAKHDFNNFFFFHFSKHREILYFFGFVLLPTWDVCLYLTTPSPENNLQTFHIRRLSLPGIEPAPQRQEPRASVGYSEFRATNPRIINSWLFCQMFCHFVFTFCLLTCEIEIPYQWSRHLMAVLIR